ncbi:hypothetical protein [Streptomyces triticiradicis]|uniref:L,D-transpeptidase n=1 Tax=Streptomyces triticiradicis TaxID=2651189 RepID=A0A7J5DJA9_9ACTN|nr:hypothetical protein [Streptomyces triticiradicis]KAB1988745.1 hypothetical protein F8144_11850 [Streptomyces triticiradicis]
MARSSSGIVAGLTVAALAAVGFLAFQASANVPDTLGDKPSVSVPAKSSAPKAPKAPKAKKDPNALPAPSGTGVRVVYSLGADRVWLVGAGGKVKRTFAVTPGTVDPAAGTYAVTSRTGSAPGSDGTQIEHIVRFTLSDGIAIGFSAAVNGSTDAPDPEKKLGGIRSSRADGDAMWAFATVGAKVVVVR